MKKKKIYYWIATGLAALMLSLLSLMAATMPEEAEKMFTHLGYTHKLIPFIVIARMMAVVIILIPMFPRLKEWAYAGLVFELVGAIYSHLRAGDTFSDWSAAFIVLCVVLASYYFHRKLETAYAYKG